MGKRVRRLITGLLKTGTLLIFVGIGALIGFAIGVDSDGSTQQLVIRTNFPNRIEDELVYSFEHEIEDQIVQQIEERIVIPPVPTIPPLPELPALPDLPEMSDLPTTIHIERAPSFFEVINGIGTVLASLGLIGLGLVILVRQRRQPKEKSPESVNAP